MKRRLLVALSALFLSLPCSALIAQQKSCPALETRVPDRKFKPGQVWSYQTRANEAASALTILQVDRSAKLGTIVHIRVDGLQMHNPGGDLVPAIEHMPFSRDALLMSVTKLTENRPLAPDTGRLQPLAFRLRGHLQPSQSPTQ